MTDRTTLSDTPVPIRLKLAGLWASIMFCYIYADYFQLFRKGHIEEMNQGLMQPMGEATQGVLLGVSVMMSIPSLLIALSLLLPAPLARWSNVLFGLVFTGIMALTNVGGAPWFYQYFSVLEMAMTLYVAWLAWRWPRG